MELRWWLADGFFAFDPHNSSLALEGRSKDCARCPVSSGLCVEGQPVRRAELLGDARYQGEPLMGEVHKITNYPLPGEVDQELVEAVEDLLRRIKRGEVTALAWAGYTTKADDTIFNGWDGAAGTSFDMLASIVMLQRAFQDRLIG